MIPFELSAATDGISVEAVRDHSGLPEELRLPAAGDVWMMSIPEGAPDAQVSVRVVGDGALLIRLGARSRSSISLDVAGSGERRVSVHILADAEADAQVLCMQTMEHGSRCFISQNAVLGPGAALRSRHASLGASESDHEVCAQMAGRSARSDIDWICYAKGAERHALRAFNVFDAPDGAGEIVMKGVAEQKAHLSERGTILIGLQGNGTNTYLTQEVLMLDASAKVDAVPGLEIRTNDVKASHSATIARVTSEDLFYFASRGIPERDARRMFVLGFLASLLGKLEDENLRARLTEVIEAKYDRA